MARNRSNSGSAAAPRGRNNHDSNASGRRPPLLRLRGQRESLQRVRRHSAWTGK